jgi:hypothetical protein
VAQVTEEQERNVRQCTNVGGVFAGGILMSD